MGWSSFWELECQNLKIYYLLYILCALVKYNIYLWEFVIQIYFFLTFQLFMWHPHYNSPFVIFIVNPTG